MSLITIIVGSGDKKAKINKFYPKKIVLGTIQGDQFFYIYIYISLEFDYKSSSFGYSIFLLISPSLSLRVSFLFYTIFFLSSPPSMCRLGHWCWSLSHQHLLEIFRSSYKVENYYSGITSTLMRPES